MYVFDHKPPTGTISRDIDRLRGLADDLENAHAGKHPGSRLIERAPILENWQLAWRGEICLVGNVAGHPEIDNGRLTRTSGLWLLSRNFGYARSLSRFYALGDPAPNPHLRIVD